MKKMIFLILFYMNLFPQTGWYKVKSGNFISIRFVDSMYGWAVGGNGIIFASTDGGLDWVLQERKTTQKLRAIFFVNRNIGWVVGDSGTILTTTNGGNNWFTQESGVTFNLRTLFFTDANYGWAGGYSNILLKTTDGGINWLKYNFNELGFIESLHFQNRNDGWLTDYNAIWRTTNSGLSWENKFVLTGARQILFTDSLTGWARGVLGFNPDHNILYKTIDGGKTWVKKLSNLPNLWTSMSGVDTTHLWITKPWTNFIKTSDGGSNWIEHSLGVNSILYSIYFIDKNNGWAAGDGGIYKTTDGGAVTSVKLEEVPTEYALYQNYPNPFNPITAITYQIPKEGLVTLKIYDILGKEVTTLLNEEKQVGKYLIEFNASKLSSGVYLYELRSGEFKLSKKLMLMK
ncbi:MAG TPA: YCF48-related protein [Ignavibacteriaceae bacterium]|nr:YCF48-related protein [Ignavibacteriaceae bacterium]